jgi:hypothetical protein
MTSNFFFTIIYCFFPRLKYYIHFRVIFNIKIEKGMNLNASFASLARHLRSTMIDSNRCYTVIVERIHTPPNQKKDKDQRKFNLKSKHFQYKFVDCLHNRKWGNVDLILTEYVDGKCFFFY